MAPPDDPSQTPEADAGDSTAASSGKASPGDASPRKDAAPDPGRAAPKAAPAKRFVPAPPKIGPPPAIRPRATTPGSGVPSVLDAKPSRTLAMDFDLGPADDGPMPLTRLTAGPARAASGAAIGETPASAEDTSPAESSGRTTAESSGRSGPPRLPVPGMLQGDGKLGAADFRSSRKRPSPGAGLDAGVLPPGGVLPPPNVAKRSAAPQPVEPENTDLLIDAVAAELVEVEPEADDDTAAAVGADAARSVGGDLSADVGSNAAVAAAAREARGGNDPRRWMYLGAGLAGLAALVWWMSRDPVPGPAPEPSRDGATAIAKAEVPEPRDGTPTPDDPQPEAAAADDAEAMAASTTAAAGLENASTGSEDSSTGVEDDSGTSAGSDTGSAEAATDDTIVIAEATEPPPTTSPSPSGSSGGKSRPKSQPRSKSQPRAKPDPAPAPTAASSSAASEPDATELLAQARSAYGSGNGVKAYGLAAKSNRLRKSTDALELMALASCMKKDKNRAKTLLKQVPLFSRPKVRTKCKDAGIPLGL